MPSVATRLKAKRQRVPYSPAVQGDVGPVTPAQMNGATIVPFREANGLESQCKRRVNNLTIMQGRGYITSRQAAAGIELFDRWEATWRSPEPSWTRVYVDASPRPGDVSTHVLEAKARLAQLSRHISRAAKPVVMAVCCHQLSIYPDYTRNTRRIPEYRALLQRELDKLADILNIR